MKAKIWRKFSMLILFSLSISLLLTSQSSIKDSVFFEMYTQKANEVLYNDFDKVIIYTDSILWLAKKTNRTDQAINALLLQIEAGSLNHKIKFNLEKLNLAIKLFDQLKEKKSATNRRVDCNIKEMLFYQYRGLGQNNKSIVVLDEWIKNLESISKLNLQDSIKLSSAYINNGVLHSEKGDYDQAINYYLKAKKYRSKIRIDDYIANVYAEKKQFSDAKYFYQNYIESSKGIDLSMYEIQFLILAYRKYIRILLHEQESDKALSLLNESLKYYKSGPYASQYPFSLFGEIYIKKGNYQKAIQQFKKGLSLKKKTLKCQKHFLYAKFHTGIGEAYSKMGKSEKALDSYQLSIINLIDNFDETDFHQDPVLRINHIASPTTLLDAFEKKISALSVLQKNQPELKELTFNTTQLAISLIDSIRLDYFSETDKQSLLAQSYSIFEKAIDLAVEDKKHDLAFQLSEKCRAVVLYDVLKLKYAEAVAELDESVLLEKHELKQKLLTAQQEIQKETDRKKLDELKRYKYALLHQKKELEAKVKSDPKVKSIIDKMSIADAATIRDSVLIDGQALLEFFSGNEFIYGFLIDKKSNSTQVKKIPWTPDLENAITRLNDVMREPNDLTYAQVAHQLYNTLIAPFFENGLPESLVLVPDGILEFIPYKALLTAPIKESDLRDFSSYLYLNNVVSLSRWSSASSFWNTQFPKNETPYTTELLAFAPSFSQQENDPGPIAYLGDKERSQLYDLTFNTQEIKNIAVAYHNSILLYDDTAQKDSFMLLGPGARIIHCATHGKVNNERPEESYIAFSNMIDTSDLEFKVGLNDLQSMNLNAEMVVLSGCETGLGKLVRGEGSISVARGFTYAGVRSIITTLWSVSDKSTCTIMDLFYKELKNGHRKDKALQLAQIKYIKKVGIDGLDPNYAHPKYWAAISATGNMEPIFPNRSFFEGGLGAFTFGAFAIIAFLLFGKRKRKSISLQSGL